MTITIHNVVHNCDNYCVKIMMFYLRHQHLKHGCYLNDIHLETSPVYEV